MFTRIKWLLKHLYTSPNSPNGRKMRIERLVKNNNITTNDATHIVYLRDYIRGYKLTTNELNHWKSFDPIAKDLPTLPKKE